MNQRSETGKIGKIDFVSDKEKIQIPGTSFYIKRNKNDRFGKLIEEKSNERGDASSALISFV